MASGDEEFLSRWSRLKREEAAKSAPEAASATPAAFQTIHVSTVVAAHWMSPEASARWRLGL